MIVGRAFLRRLLGEHAAGCRGRGPDKACEMGSCPRTVHLAPTRDRRLHNVGVSVLGERHLR